MRHAFVALVLLVAMPSRVLAMAAMPCCPPAPAAGLHAMHDGSTTGSSATADVHDDDHGHVDATTPDCCAIALTSTTVVPSLPDYVPPHGRPQRATTVAAFLTDPPERPPRTIA